MWSFPHRHGDATGKPETRDETRGRRKTSISCETLSTRYQVGMSQSATPATQNDMTTCLETFEKERFCSFPHRHGINDATTTRRRPDDDATPTRRRRDEPLEANKGPAPRPPDYKREPFAAHSGKKGLSGMNIQNHQITSSTPSTYPQPGILHANSDKLRDLIRKWVTYPNSRVPMRSC